MNKTVEEHLENLKEFQEEKGNNWYPDFDEIYKRYDKLKQENIKLKEDLKEIKNNRNDITKDEVYMNMEKETLVKIINLKRDTISYLASERRKLQQRIDKAIKYINNASYFDGSSMCANDLLQILGDKENE